MQRIIYEALLREERPMRPRNQLLICLALIGFITVSSSPCSGQALSGAPAEPQYKYSTPMPPGIASPNKVETRLGTLSFFDGFPDKPSAEKLFDNLDFQRAV